MYGGGCGGGGGGGVGGGRCCSAEYKLMSRPVSKTHAVKDYFTLLCSIEVLIFCL